MKKRMKKWRFPVVIIMAGLITLAFAPRIGMNALSFTGKAFLNFLFMLTPIFICIGLMDVWITRDAMIKIMGAQSGFRGMMIALLLGMVTAVPLYALLPVAGVLLKKGCRIFNVLLFLCASASIRIPLLLFEVSSLGWKFTFVRFGLNLAIVFAIAFIIQSLLSEADQKAIYDTADHL